MLKLAEAYFGNVHELMDCLHPGLADRHCEGAIDTWNTGKHLLMTVHAVVLASSLWKGSSGAISFKQKRRDGEDIEQVDPKDGCRPLHAAVITEQEEAVAYLLRKLGFELLEVALTTHLQRIQLNCFRVN